MASIEKRKTARGLRYRVRITFKGQPRIPETFTTRREAKIWAERTTEAMRACRFQPEAESEQRTMGDLVDRYILDKLPSSETRRRIAASWNGGAISRASRR